MHFPCASIQSHTYAAHQRLADGTEDAMHPLAFSAHLADTETFHYCQAIKQADHTLFMHAMIKEIQDLIEAGVFQY